MRSTLDTKLVLVLIGAVLLTCAAMMATGYIYLDRSFQQAAQLEPGLAANVPASDGLFAALFCSLAAAALIMLLGSVYICRTLRPIKKCVSFAEAVAQGDNVDLDVYRGDCLGHLAEALRGMVGKLRAQSHWYESILNALPYGISVTDMDMRWTFCNTVALNSMGKTDMAEVRGLHCSEKKGNICNTPQCGIEQLRQGNHNVLNHMPNGRSMEISLDYLHDQEGQRIGHLEVARDVTERLRLQKEAEEASVKARMDTVNSLEGVVAGLNATADQLTGKIDDVREHTRRVAARMAETATAMEEMNSTVLEVAGNAENAAHASSSVQGQARDGTERMLRTIRSIQSVQEQSNGLKSEMESLDRQARDIGAVLTLIRDIADQTNLLALNAAIEAARAGDAGRGFAVVADEVRKLAEKTMSATRDVESAIETIQQGTGRSALTVESAVRAIDEVTGMAQDSGGSLEQIFSLANDSSSRVAAIATAATEQSAASEEINRNIAEVNDLSSNMAEAMNNAAAEVDAMNRQAQVIAAILDNIRNQGADATSTATAHTG
ncbi:methyl-accepting chemotaxis protein [Desulfovibrio sp. ZJ200]|uniref:methyl-accepting chemotaxis protein n=1 Tax=Desulfovibrio sp. ZJ200 TaxID=2709792 RepID=UPI0013EA52B2|nr:methyl-accepting chemotaxis protein [Desulfovibrio sp. ZJ200]